MLALPPSNRLLRPYESAPSVSRIDITAPAFSAQNRSLRVSLNNQLPFRSSKSGRSSPAVEGIPLDFLAFTSNPPTDSLPACVRGLTYSLPLLSASRFAHLCLARRSLGEGGSLASLRLHSPCPPADSLPACVRGLPMARRTSDHSRSSFSPREFLNNLSRQCRRNLNRPFRSSRLME